MARVCGDNGFKTRAGKPCRYPIGPDDEGCPHHTVDADGRPKALAFQTKGGQHSRVWQALPEGYKIPELDSLAGIREACALMAHLALKRNVERWRLSEARGALDLLIKAEGVQVQREMVQKLTALEHGGAAVAFLERLNVAVSEGKRRPLPARGVVALPTAAEESA